MTIRYKNKWQPFTINQDFWREVLEGQTITKLEFDGHGISCIVLDNGERVSPHPTGRLSIIVDDDLINEKPPVPSCESCEEPISRDPVLLRPLPCPCAPQISQ